MDHVIGCFRSAPTCTLPARTAPCRLRALRRPSGGETQLRQEKLVVIVYTGAFFLRPRREHVKMLSGARQLEKLLDLDTVTPIDPRPGS